MNSANENINPWAVKLQELPVGNPAAAWARMEQILDREMPITRPKDLRRWFLLILLLLLIIGICNCPGTFHLQSFSIFGSDGNHSPVSETQSDTNNSKTRSLLPETPVFRARLDSTGILKEQPPAKFSESHMGHSANSSLESTEKSGVDVAPDSITETENRNRGQKAKKSLSGSFTNSTTPDSMSKGKTKLAQNTEPNTDSSNYEPAGTRPLVKLPVLINRSGPGKFSKTKKGGFQSDSLSGKITQETKNNSPQKSREPELEKGWELGLGLNQFFPVGSQHESYFNSDGTSGIWKDYIPAPMGRYYFSKSIYLQLESQFNTPQYTKNLLVSQSVTSSMLGNSQIQQSITIKKLYYFNVPLSVHFRVLRNLYLGTGLQFSQLTNGVAEFQQKLLPISGPDTLLPAKLQNFKSSPIYHELKTDEIRFLFDLNYHWKPLSLGIRYNQAFTDFVKVNIGNGQITQARNQSFQLYLRYVIWGNRKKLMLKSK